MKNKKLRKRLIILGVTAVVLAGAIIGTTQYIRYRNDQKTVEVMPMAYLTSNYWGDETSCQGNIVSDYIQEIYPDSSKSISEIFVAEGQQVSVGDKLLQYNREALELDVEAKKIAQQQAQVRIEEAQRQLKKLEKTKPYSAPSIVQPSKATPKPVVTPKPTPVPKPTPTPTPTPFPTPDVAVYSELTVDSVPYQGSGTAEDPYVFLCRDGFQLTPDFLRLLFGLGTGTEPTPTPEPVPEPTSEPASEPISDSSPGPEESSPPTPDEPAPSAEDGTQPPESNLTSPFAAVFEVREHDSNYGKLLSSLSLDGTGLSGTVSLPGLLGGVTVATDLGSDAISDSADTSAATKAAATPKPTPEPDNYNHMNYTRAELDQLIKEKKREITNLQHDMKQAQLDLDQANRALENSTVLSTVDGQVRTLIDIDTASAESRPFLVVSGAQQYYVNGTLNETLLGSVNIGDEVTVNSWMNGMTYTAQIVSISDYPAQGDYYYSYDSNPNSSSYEFTAVILDADDTIQSGTYVDITMNVNAAAGTDAFYLDKMYIREDDSGYYVMKAGKDNRLLKSYITVGKSIWGGQYLEIKSGVTLEDFVAFPYGPDVKEGVRAILQETKEPPWPEDSEPSEDSTGSSLSSGLDGTEDPTVDGDTPESGVSEDGEADLAGALPDGAVITGKTEDGLTFKTEDGGGIILD